MARRDNQGIQIAMIVFIFLTFIFMLTTYLFYNSTTTLKGQLAKAEQDLSAANNGSRAAETLLTELKTSIGVDAAADDSSTQAQVTEAVTVTFGQGLPPENQNFLDILGKMTERVGALSSDVADRDGQLTQLRNELDAATKAFAASKQELAVFRDQAKAGWEQAVADRDQLKASSEARQSQLSSQKNEATQKMTAAIAKAANDVNAALESERLTKSQLSLTKDELNAIKKDTPDQFDGQVVGVVARTRTVTLNIGRKDGVRSKTSFSVYDADDSNVRTAEKKASIEVTRVLGDHRCEARITSDYSTPIVPDDYIYSPIWSPNQRLGVALVGEMDIDKDGFDDRKMLRNLILEKGGKVDAEDVPDSTKISGQLTVNTRYIVVGEAKEIRGESGMKELLKQARDYSVEQMSVEELLDLIGYSGRARSISFQGGAGASDFPVVPKNEVTVPSIGTTSFRKRTPTPRRDRLPLK